MHECNVGLVCVNTQVFGINANCHSHLVLHIVKWPCASSWDRRRVFNAKVIELLVRVQS